MENLRITVTMFEGGVSNSETPFMWRWKSFTRLTSSFLQIIYLVFNGQISRTGTSQSFKCFSILRPGPGDDFKFMFCQIFWCFGVSDVEPEAKATPGGFLWSFILLADPSPRRSPRYRPCLRSRWCAQRRWTGWCAQRWWTGRWTGRWMEGASPGEQELFDLIFCLPILPPRPLDTELK